MIIKNGKVVSGNNTWCTILAYGLNSDAKAILNLEDFIRRDYK